ncbi:MAG: SGNH/GDSL hydrolase family protein [Butyricicoccus sp.]
MIKKPTGILTKILTILFALVIVAGLAWSLLSRSQESQELEENTKSTFVDKVEVSDTEDEGNESQSTEDKKTKKEETQTLYTKLSKGNAVKIAVIGDTFGASVGATPGEEWYVKLKEKLQETYQSEVTVDNYSVAVTTAYQGYCTVKQNEWDSYDMVLVCFGSMDQNGELSYFQRDYESIIRGLRAKNDTMVIMPMISTYVNDSNFSGTVRDIADQYQLDCLNMNNAFVDSGMDEEELTTDGTYPNDTGYQLYADAVVKKIEENIQNNAEIYNGKVSAQYDGVREMDDLTFISADDLVYVSDNEYSYTGEATVLGVSYQPTSTGSDTLTILVNGYPVNTIDCVTSYDLDKAHYAIGASDLSEDDTVTIQVNNYSGMEFNGIMVSE